MVLEVKVDNSFSVNRVNEQQYINTFILNLLNSAVNNRKLGKTRRRKIKFKDYISLRRFDILFKYSPNIL